MLVLTRRIGETLFFELPTGDGLAVAVLDNSCSQERVGGEAPAEVNVVREELRLQEAFVGSSGWRERTRGAPAER